MGFNPLRYRTRKNEYLEMLRIAPGLMEAVWFKSGCYGHLTSEIPIIVGFSFCWRNIADGRQHSVLVKLRHPLQRREFHRFLGLPRRPAMNQLGFVTCRLLSDQKILETGALLG